jgi:outer membrane cobalamin receptor
VSKTALAAVEDAYAFSRMPVTVSGGMGYSYTRCEGRSNAPGHFEKGSVDMRMGISCSFTEDVSAYLSGGAYTRYPTIHQLYSGEYANARLKAERSLKLGAGALWSFHSWFEISADAYNEEYADLIDRRTFDTVSTYVNISGAWSRGVECGASVAVPKILTRLSGDYTLTVTYDGARNLPLPYVPLHSVSAGITQPFLDGGKAVFSAHWALKRNNESSFRQLLEDYAVANSRLSYRWRIIEAVFAVENIFDENYTTESVGYPMPGRTYRVEINIAYNVDFRGNKNIRRKAIEQQR